MAESQRRFAVMGENLFQILMKLSQNQRLCRLLKYQDGDPFAESKPNVDGTKMLNNNILYIPKYPESGVEGSFVMTLFDKFSVNPTNPDFKTSVLRFEVICPYTEWIVNDSNLRPYLIMQEIDKMFNQAKLSGIGNLQFVIAEPLTLSPQMGGYLMKYKINEFN